MHARGGGRGSTHVVALNKTLQGKVTFHCPTSFSLDFLVQFLEQQVCSLNWDVGFVTYTMQEIGVPLPRLLEVYDQLFKARVSGKAQTLLCPGVVRVHIITNK